MELSFKDLRKREVINVVDGKSLGYITDIELRFPSGKMSGIVVPGKSVNCFSRFFTKSSLYIPVDKIRKIGNDVILVDLKCGEVCSPSTGIGVKEKPSFREPCPPPCSPCQPPCPPCPPQGPPKPRNSASGYGEGSIFDVRNGDDNDEY